MPGAPCRQKPFRCLGPGSDGRPFRAFPGGWCRSRHKGRHGRCSRGSSTPSAWRRLVQSRWNGAGSASMLRLAGMQGGGASWRLRRWQRRCLRRSRAGGGDLHLSEWEAGDPASENVSGAIRRKGVDLVAPGNWRHQLRQLRFVLPAARHELRCTYVAGRGGSGSHAGANDLMCAGFRDPARVQTALLRARSGHARLGRFWYVTK